MWCVLDITVTIKNNIMCYHFDAYNQICEMCLRYDIYCWPQCNMQSLQIYDVGEIVLKSQPLVCSHYDMLATMWRVFAIIFTVSGDSVFWKYLLFCIHFDANSLWFYPVGGYGDIFLLRSLECSNKYVVCCHHFSLYYVGNNDKCSFGIFFTALKRS